jgi:AcrR family transcriptional regulator
MAQSEPLRKAASEPAARPSRRKRRSAREIRDLILEAAAREFEENGFSGATTAAIAQRAEVTEAQIFRLFATKADLFRAAIFQPLNRHFADFQARYRGGPPPGESTRDLARRYIDELQEFMAEHSGMLMSLIVANAYSPGAAQRIGEIDGLIDYFEQGRATMAERTMGKAAVPPELMVRVSFAAVLACVMFKDWLFPPGIASDAEIRKAIADFTIDGISANAQPGL